MKPSFLNFKTSKTLGFVQIPIWYLFNFVFPFSLKWRHLSRPNRRRPGRRRPGRIRAGGRRFPAARRPLPVYYDDYGYDEYYDDYYDAYYDYYEEEEPEETVPTLGEGLTDKDLISKLWLDFIKGGFCWLHFQWMSVEIPLNCTLGQSNVATFWIASDGTCLSRVPPSMFHQIKNRFFCFWVDQDP